MTDHGPDGILADPPDQLRAYIRDGRIAVVPAKRARRRLLLDQVAQAFEPGRQYPESAVDEILKTIFDDHCALRRYLVDESFLSRTADGVYWRAGRHGQLRLSVTRSVQDHSVVAAACPIDSVDCHFHRVRSGAGEAQGFHERADIAGTAYGARVSGASPYDIRQ